MNEFEWVFSKETGFRREDPGPPAAPSSGAVIVRPRQVGICGSDHYAMESHDIPFCPGHEWVGIVEKIGPGVEGLSPGDRVTSAATFGCLNCASCRLGRTNLCEQPLHLGSDRLGALRSWFEVLAGNLVKVPGEAHEAHVLHEVFGVADEAVRLLKDAMQPEEKEVLILGGGPIGLSIALLLKEEGREPLIVDKNAYRLAIAKQRGISAIPFAQALIDGSLVRRYSVAVDASSDYRQDGGAFRFLPIFLKPQFVALILAKYVESPVLPRAFHRMGGQMLWMKGIGLDALQRSVDRWHPRLAELGQGLITHTFGADEVPAAFRLAREKTGSLKVVVDFTRTRH